ncbi:DUF4035 domain-containing protein [Serratia fonticola]|uniref:phage tail assembly protein T n=1 Tax=Serratia fonticola TaxID=47917 RepID=UPI001575D02A|nr:DUF4035 domain-containing protein [Serratia fonticola]NTY85568.1 DUF4035 domain-containing protein [Serratia fonticola]NTZ11589.1 DUF4035 domain-containing protein [Serratia fonticola]
MQLALRLGKTLGELQKTMGVSELRLWAAFNQISPIGDERGDYQAAQISAAISNSQGIEADINKIVLKWSSPKPEEEEDEWADMEAQFKKLAE